MNRRVGKDNNIDEYKRNRNQVVREMSKHTFIPFAAGVEKIAKAALSSPN